MGHSTLNPPPPPPGGGPDVLDNAAWHSLTGRHAALSEGNEIVRRFQPDVSPFAAVRSWDDPDVWDAIVDLVGPGGIFPVSGNDPALPPGWEVVTRGAGVARVAPAARPPPIW